MTKEEYERKIKEAKESGVGIVSLIQRREEREAIRKEELIKKGLEASNEELKVAEVAGNSEQNMDPKSTGVESDEVMISVASMKLFIR